MDENHSQLVTAEFQLNRAIQLFLDAEDFYSSGTLAGAAEEILGRLLQKEGKEHALDRLISSTQRMLTEGEIDAISDSKKRNPRGKIGDLLNFYRNWLKHYREDDSEIYIDTKEAASELIDRAVINFFQFTHRETSEMRKFRIYQADEYS